MNKIDEIKEKIKIKGKQECRKVKRVLLMCTSFSLPSLFIFFHCLSSCAKIRADSRCFPLGARLASFANVHEKCKNAGHQYPTITGDFGYSNTSECNTITSKTTNFWELLTDTV